MLGLAKRVTAWIFRTSTSEGMETPNCILNNPPRSGGQKVWMGVKGVS